MIVHVSIVDPTPNVLQAIAEVLSDTGGFSPRTAIAAPDHAVGLNYWVWLQWLVRHADQAPALIAALEKLADVHDPAETVEDLISFLELVKPLLSDLPAGGVAHGILSPQACVAVEDKAMGLFGGDGTKLKKLFETFFKYAPVLIELIGGLK